MILFFDRILQKILRIYRKKLFLKKIKCTHDKVNIVGSITLINTNIKIGKNVTIYPNVMFFGDGPIEIGDNVDIGNGTLIYSSKNGGGITIGRDTSIAAQSYVIDCDHGINLNELIRTQKNTVQPITIGNDVWIAAGCKVLKGSNIGDGAVIGAQSVVKGQIPENAIAVGIPANVLKYRK